MRSEQGPNAPWSTLGDARAVLRPGNRATLAAGGGNPILVNGIKDMGSVSNELSTDWLVSYRPVPGTLMYLGYGSILEEPREFRFRDLKRTSDGFFGKISYPFRL